MVGTATAPIAAPALADTLQHLAESELASLPRPRHRTLGRTGLKISVVSSGAMLTHEPEVLRSAIERGGGHRGGRNEEIVGRAVRGVGKKVYLATKPKPRYGRWRCQSAPF